MKARGEEQRERSDAWKKPKKAKRKVEHKTYEEIVAEAGHDTPSGIGQIIDATGATVRFAALNLTTFSLTYYYSRERLPRSRMFRLPLGLLRLMLHVFLKFGTTSDS